MSQFVFEGDFRRKPVQQLGGSSRASEQKDAVLQKAQAERQRRERDRLEASAIVTLQGYMRGCLERKRLMAEWRNEFDCGRFSFRQIYLINRFWRRSRHDIERLLKLGKHLLTESTLVVNKMMEDPLAVHSIKKILRMCIISLNVPNIPQAVFLRLIEFYTNPRRYEPDDSDEEAPLSHKSVLYTANIWIYLIQEANFFSAYRQFLERKLPAMTSENDKNRIMGTYDYLSVYKRIMSLPSELKSRGISVYVRNEFVERRGNADRFRFKINHYNNIRAIELIYSKFVNSLMYSTSGEDGGDGGVIPLEGSSGIIAYYVIPGLKDVIPLDDWMKALTNVYPEHSDTPNSVRQILYATLIFMKHTSSTDIGPMLEAISLLLISIDPMYSPVNVTMGLSRHIMEWEDEMDVEEDDMSDISDRDALDKINNYLQECPVLYKLLRDVINKMKIVPWLSPFQICHWGLLCPILSVIVRLEPRRSQFDFEFLKVLSYKRDFMRSLCLHCMTTSKLDNDNVLTFCWFFGYLLGTLHDAEFLSCIPISKDELAKLIVTLVDTFSDTLLSNYNAMMVGTVSSMALKSLANLLMSLHDRNTRMNLFKEDVFISSPISKMCPVEMHTILFHEFNEELPFNPNGNVIEARLLKVLKEYPFALSFHDRVKVWNRLLNIDKEMRDPNPMSHREDIQIRRTYIYEDASEKLSPENVRDIRRQIRISLVNIVGVMEAGIDGGGLLREFLTEATKAAVDPNRGLFRYDSQNRIYPNPVAKKLSDYRNNFQKHFFVVGRLVGKALYEQTLLELPMAAFFIQTCIEGKISSAVDFLATLDPTLHKNLLALKTFDGDLITLGLDFTIASDELGETSIFELKPVGKDTAVDKSNVIEYIHLVADYKINKEIGEECRAFRAGMLDVIPEFRMFSWRELQTLISGSDKPIDISDWMSNTNYGPGFNETHASIELFWQVVRGFDEKSLRMLLKFVTSCSRPPLLGFKDLVPKFGIQSAGKIDRLPTAATCMNLLKLPEFEDEITMREKILYVINAQAGFELS